MNLRYNVNYKQIKLMKKMYLVPTVNVEEVKIEKGFAASKDSYELQNFQYEGSATDTNTAW